MKFMNLIQYIESLVDKEMLRLSSSKNFSITTGDMGLILSLSYIYMKTNNSLYLKKINILLRNLSKKISGGSLLEIYQGVSGIGLGVLLLRRWRILKENPNMILKDIDNYIYRKSIIAINNYVPS